MMSLFAFDAASDDVGIVNTVVFGSLPSGLTIALAEENGRPTARSPKSASQQQAPLPQRSPEIMGTIVATLF
jgi:hypothetical protein